MNKRFVAVVVAVFSFAAYAEDPPAQAAAAAPAAPSADEINRVLDYQDNGKDSGPVLLKIQPCNKVDTKKGSDTQFTCIEPITGNVKKGSTVNAWLQFFCPKGGKYEDVSLQWLLDGAVRTTTDVTVEGTGRTRTWKASTLSKPGKWTLKLVRGATELGSATVTVDP
jgi:hypothetical protein